MQQHQYQYFFILLLALLSGNANAIPTPAPPDIAANGHLLIDFDSGKVISQKNVDERLEPASLTKIMTAYVIFHEITSGNLGLEDEVLISKKAWKTPGSRMFVEVGKKVKVKDLLKGMIIQSGNDASVALAEHVAGSESTFASLMNSHAQRLGMTSTHFVNATGLPDPEHYTTAADIAKVAMAAIREFPEFYKMYSTKAFEYNNIKQHNRNKLLWRDKSVDGMKTGHTDAAGYCLVASAKRDNMRLVSVVMGAKSEEARAAESQKLLNYGFRFFETHKLYAANEALSQPKVWKGKTKILPAGLDRDLFVTIPKNQYKNLNASISLKQPLIAPIQKGETVGEVTVELNGTLLHKVPLLALKEIPEGGLVDRLIDSLMLMLE